MRRLIWCATLLLALGIFGCTDSPGKKLTTDQLISQLDSKWFKEREQAEQELRGRGVFIVPDLRAARKATNSNEVADRLDRIIADLVRLDWHTEMGEARLVADKENKPILVFSTIGPVNGFAWMGSNLMRTVTFADLDVIDQLKKNFVLVWQDQSPELGSTGEQEPATPEQAKNYPQGAGDTNVITFIANADGKVSYRLLGFWRPQEYLSEIKFGLEMAKKSRGLKDDDMAKILKDSILAKKKTIAQQRQEMQAKYPDEWKKKVFESEIRKQDAALGLLEKSHDLALHEIGFDFQAVTDIYMRRAKVIK